MSKFRRVAELTTPDYLQKAVDNNFESDPYGYLKETATQRKQVIAKNKTDYKASKVDEPKAWEKVHSQEVFQDHLFPRNEEELRASVLGSSNKIVRSAHYLTDQPDTTRSVEDLACFSDSDYMNAMLRGASIWNPDMDEIASAFMSSQMTQGEELVVNKEVIELMKRNKHEAWESENLSGIKKSPYATARAHPILRTASEFTVDSPNGLIDWGQLDSQERQRLEMRENKRRASAEIKAIGRSREEVHQQWEDSLDLESGTLQSYYGNQGIDLNID